MQRKKAIRQEYQNDYFYNRPTWEIERQANGEEEEEEYVEPAINLHILVPSSPKSSAINRKT